MYVIKVWKKFCNNVKIAVDKENVNVSINIILFDDMLINGNVLLNQLETASF